MKGKPEAFLSYAELSDFILSLSDAEAGRLFKGKYTYYFHGVEPDFTDCQKLLGVWAIEKSKLDRDRMRYYVNSVHNSYKAYCRDCKPEEPKPITVWFECQKILRAKENRITEAFEMLEPDDLI